jgi:hypothetical protein
MHLDGLPLVIIKTSAFESRVIDLKTERTHKMQPRACIGAQADHVTRIGRNFWLDKDDIKHERYFARVRAATRAMTP